MVRRLFVAALALGTLTLGACTPTYPKCDTDEHCKEHGEVCLNGTCQECGRDGDCKAGFVCTDTKCVPKPECTVNTDCSSGFKCQSQKCVPECAVETDCAQGMRCKDGRCAPPPECTEDTACGTGERCQNERCVEDPTQQAAACTLQTVLFDFNEYSLTSDARRMLDANAECLRSRKGGTVTLAGHADERGTEEYNLHLGERRANAVKKYLSALGVQESGLRTVSYGEERPANRGSNDAAWNENRRVEFAE
jgi:peptidoglycan-associated lipoprotein